MGGKGRNISLVAVIFQNQRAVVGGAGRNLKIDDLSGLQPRSVIRSPWRGSPPVNFDDLYGIQKRARSPSRHVGVSHLRALNSFFRTATAQPVFRPA